MTAKVQMPREKLERMGVSALSDTDLVSVLIGSGIEGKGVFEVSRSVARLMSQRRNMDVNTSEVSCVNLSKELTWRDYKEVKGIGIVKAMQLECAIELGKRYVGHTVSGRQVIKGREDVVRLCSYLKQKRQEHVVVIALNARNEIVGRKTVAIGSLNKAVVEPREILGWALSTGVSGIILVHNHPSGSVDPSVADTVFTERVKNAAELLGVELIDHVIV